MQAAVYRPFAVVLAGGRRRPPRARSGRFRGEELAPPDRFYAGGDFSMRGFDMDGVLPAGGSALLVGSLELQASAHEGLLVRRPSRDVGNVYPSFSRTDMDQLRYVGGVGLRLP